MKKYGFIFSDEGLGGAYEYGIFKAQQAIGNQIGYAVGSSFGTISAALVAQDNPEKMAQFWEKADINPLLELNAAMVQQFLTNWRDSDEEAVQQSIFSALFESGIDLEPVYHLLGEYIDEKQLRSSNIGFGVVAHHLKTLEPLALTLDDIPEGELINTLVLSIALPNCQAHLPGAKPILDNAKKNKALHHLASLFDCDFTVCLEQAEPDLPELFHDIALIPIKSSEYPESTVPLSVEAISHFVDLGVLDSLKAFNIVSGKYFYIDQNDRHSFYTKMNRRISRPERSGSTWEKTVMLLNIPAVCDSEVYFTAIADLLKRTNYPKDRNILLSLSEMAGRILNVERCRIYSPDSFLYELLLQIEKIAQDESEAIRTHPYMQDTSPVVSEMYAPIKQLDFLAFYFRFIREPQIESPGKIREILKYAAPEFVLAMLLLLKIRECCAA